MSVDNSGVMHRGGKRIASVTGTGMSKPLDSIIRRLFYAYFIMSDSHCSHVISMRGR